MVHLLLKFCGSKMVMNKKLEALYIPGRTRSEPASAILTIVPKKEDDNSSYRCTVWNRAIPENRLMEASMSITTPE